MILGFGIDLLDLRRAEGLLARHGDRAWARLMRPSEQEFYARSPLGPALGFAKVWAYKEAMIKALGRRPLPFSWHDFEVAHDPGGKPFGRLHHAALQQACALSARSLSPSVFLTSSDDPPYIIAACVIEVAST